MVVYIGNKFYLVAQAECNSGKIASGWKPFDAVDADEVRKAIQGMLTAQADLDEAERLLHEWSKIGDRHDIRFHDSDTFLAKRKASGA